MPKASYSHDELAVRALHDKEAFGELYDYYFPRVYNYVYARISDRDAADELTSKVFERALSRLETYNAEKGSYSTWLFTITGNIIIDYFRSGKKYMQEPIELYPDLPSEQPGVEEQILMDEYKSCLMKSLVKLSDRERSIIALKFWSQLTNREIAKLEKIGESNVAVILYRAIKRLRDLMKEADR